MRYLPVDPDLSKKGEDKNEEQPKKTGFNKRKFAETQLGYRYKFRRNTITKIPEWMPAEGEGKWTPMNDDTLNSFERALQLDGHTFITVNLLHKIINSDFSPKYHPIKDYFNDLEPYENGEPDYIAQLASTVKTSIRKDAFLKYLKKWLVAVVANAFIDNRCANHLCLIFAGSQGDGKSTWMDNLLPKKLTGYLDSGSVDPDNKDSLIATTENLFVNMDDYFADITQKKINSFKSFLTKPTVKLRRPHGRYFETLPKICSFMGSTNEHEFLFDMSGSRRFLVFKVEDVDLDASKSIDMDKVYAQAFYLWQADFVYWIPKSEIKDLEAQNSEFKVQVFEVEMLTQFYKAPAKKIKDQGGEIITFMTTTEIKNDLEFYVNKTPISLKRLGGALRKLGFERVKKSVNGVSMYGWNVIKINRE